MPATDVNHELKATVDIVDVPCEEAHPGQPFCGWKHQKTGAKHYYFNGQEIDRSEFDNLVALFKTA